MDLRIFILTRMMRQKIIGAKHMRYKTILPGIRSEKIGLLKKAIKELINEGYLVWYNKSKKAL